ncbi:hypothetical protein DICVIV_12381, partial [Dictyocaulus viviparus]
MLIRVLPFSLSNATPMSIGNFAFSCRMVFYIGPENPPTEVSVDINEANIAVVRWKKPNSTREILNYVIYFTRDLGISNEDFHDWQMVEVPATQT